MKQRKRIAAILLAMALMLAGFASAEVLEIPEWLVEAEELTLRAAALSEEPVFVDWVAEETPMQLIARKNGQGRVRLAFNTCQSCNGSPWAWFEYLGDGRIQCQNCGQVLPLSGMEDEARGCAPIPVPEYTENEDGTVTVPERVLSDAAHLFVNWRKTSE